MLKRAIFFFSVTGLLCGLSGTVPLVHADPPAPKASTGAQTGSDQAGIERFREKNLSGETSPRRPPLPAYFGQIGISDKQRLDLQAVQLSYEERLDKLREELKALTKERDEKLENLLTDGQKLRLQELRAVARQKAASQKDAPKKK